VIASLALPSAGKRHNEAVAAGVDDLPVESATLA